jgi:two-component SAPR family response regulator
MVIVTVSFSLLKKWKKKKNRSFNSGISNKQIQEFVPFPEKNHIRLFGDFKIVNKEGEDITSQFTPKIKHLFLLILLHSQQNKKGISTKELSEILWPNNSYQNTKNSRGVTMRKLRLILESMDKVEILFHLENWYMKFSGEVYCDYIECLKLLDETKENDPTFYTHFYKIVKRGEIFKDESHNWLDDFKGYIANNIVDILMKFIQKLNEDKDNDLILKLTDRVLVADPVNEQALAIKLNLLVKQNNYKLARFTYERFAALYLEMYDEKFSSSFDSLIS